MYYETTLVFLGPRYIHIICGFLLLWHVGFEYCSCLFFVDILNITFLTASFLSSGACCTAPSNSRRDSSLLQWCNNPHHPPIGIGGSGDCDCPAPAVSIVVFEDGVPDVHEPGIQLHYPAPECICVVAEKLRPRDGEICPLNKEACPELSWRGKDSSAPEYILARYIL